MEIVKSLYDQRTTLPSDLEYYEGLLEDNDFISIAPQVYYLLKSQQKMEQTPTFFQEYLKMKFDETLYLNFFIRNQMNSILEEFEKMRIDVIPIKGVMFSGKYFGHIGARATSDIDLLIRFKNIDQAIDCLESLGFKILDEQIKNHFHLSLSKELPGSVIPLKVELHWDIIKKNTSNFDIEEFWESSNRINTYNHIKQLSDYHTFYLICLHGWRHNLDSLKYFLDIMQLIKVLKGDIDFNSLMKDTTSHRTRKRIVRTLSIVYAEFPFLDHLAVFPYKRLQLFSMLDKGFLRKMYKYVDFLDYQLFSYDVLVDYLAEVFHWSYRRKS